ncbi:MAG: putative toxin-antitoxin system toxin component, PIN family [Nitrospirota bacterium]|jgi:putative PIN family toxin of toxin-antitoxin system|nr:putative toxin-antitoxin system toxin component, PIN family [Nitrospirota bacterium]MDH4359391.1 putative toxin-antitoxin system toxin component, PIN family [Nitrospirota bacterium]MDH5297122.1 putative toxin-antitoxin system toxin component, PIN family [Nitrospirota bacterium]
MKVRTRIVLDTNALVSRLLLPDSIPGQAVRKAVDEGEILMSESTLYELAEVLGREKFDAYVTIQDRKEFLRILGRIVEMVQILQALHDCRDVRDNHILEVAVNGRAQVIATGDEDLLVLNPFRGIPIIRPADYLEWKLASP